VITFEGMNDTLHRYAEASCLTRTRLVLGPSVLAFPNSRGRGFGGNADSLKSFLDDATHTDAAFITLRESDIEDLRTVYRTITNKGAEIPHLKDAMSRFAQLDRIPKESPLRFLGYVSILESLITHAPDPKDPYDSLTRQVRQKMILVGRRAKLQLPYALFGDDVKPETLWTRIYEYRSAVAHGVTPDFGKRLSMLKNQSVARDFICQATVTVMRQMLEEPELIADLRMC
jgi:hypothetical protein